MSVTTAAQNGAVATPAGNNSADKASAAPTEVGWLFVPQYYTFLNNDPSKLHCFYSKRSTLVHGTEQEEAPLCIGQQEIHEKIVSLGFSDAKVYVSNVDSQASAAGGIIIQVLGEMSNKGGAWRKFAQTFFLAEQPNGYFVLNDIFRYLKEDDEIEEEAQDVDEAIQNEVREAAAKGVDVVHQVEIVPGTAQAAIGSASVTTAPANVVAQAHANGDLKPQEATPASAAEVGMDKKVTAVEREQTSMQSKGEAEAAESAAQPANPAASTPALNAAAPSPSEAQTAQAAAPKPSGPKTWANLAASNVTKWGSAVNAEVRGISSARENAQQQAGPRASASSASTNGPPAARSGHVFIKNVVVENMPAEGLQSVLESKFGPMKECQVIPAKACAFGEFASADAARKAIQMSLPSSQGGEGGVKVGKNGWSVIVEEKRKPGERGAAGASAGRGGRGGNAAGQGSGRGGRGGSGRGGAAGRGGRGAAP